jgi:cell division protein FtsB
MSEEKITVKDYTSHSNRVLNRAIALRKKQIERAEAGNNRTDKSIAQLKYELEAMTNTLLERAMTK